MREKIFFVAGTGTDVGKTYLLERVCELLKERGIEAVKPIISGYEVGQVNDTMRILAALKKEPTLENIDSISPWRFAVPTSPHLAGEEVDFALLTKFCRERIALAKKSNRYLLIEGAGGVMTPINTRYTFSDLIKELKIPTLLVSTNYLGAISHILTAAAILQAQGIAIENIIINQQDNSHYLERDLIGTIENFSKARTVALETFLKNLTTFA